MVILGSGNMNVDDCSGTNLNEDLAFALQEFAKSGMNEIQPMLDAYITSISISGETRASWHLVKPLLRVKLDTVMHSFNDDTPVDNLFPRSNMETFKFSTCRSQVLSILDDFPDAPFSIQRLCELLQSPRKNYNRVDKFFRGVMKVLSVTSCVDPHGVKIVTDRERHYSDTTTSSLNGGDYPSLTSPRPRRDSRAVSPSIDAAEFRTANEGSDVSSTNSDSSQISPGSAFTSSPGRRSRSPGGSLVTRSSLNIPVSDPDLNGHHSPPPDTTSPKRPRLQHDLLGPPHHPAPVARLGSPTSSHHHTIVAGNIQSNFNCNESTPVTSTIALSEKIQSGHQSSSSPPITDYFLSSATISSSEPIVVRQPPESINDTQTVIDRVEIEKSNQSGDVHVIGQSTLTTESVVPPPVHHVTEEEEIANATTSITPVNVADADSISVDVTEDQQISTTSTDNQIEEETNNDAVTSTNEDNRQEESFDEVVVLSSESTDDTVGSHETNQSN